MRAVKLWMAQNGNKIAGRKVEVILKDDGAVPDTTKRLAQELIVNDKVAVIAGFGITPTALATAPLGTQSKTPMVVMAAATSSITAGLAVLRPHQLHAAAGDDAASPTGRRRTRSRRRSRWSPTTAPASTPRSSSTASSASTAARCSTSCARRCARPTSRRCCRRWPTPSPMRCSCSCRRARARRS